MDAFLGEIRDFGFGFAPKGWSQCNGQLLAINANQALFSLLGTQYGGDGRTTFALPDLRGRAIVGSGISGGDSYPQGQKAGLASVALVANEMPAHSHGMVAAAGSGAVALPATFAGTPPVQSGSGNYLANATTKPTGGTPVNMYATTTTRPQPLAITSVVPTGGGQAHDNMQPYAATNYCIAIQGIFPTRQ